jgi:hypothetical protein
MDPLVAAGIVKEELLEYVEGSGTARRREMGRERPRRSVVRQ